MKDYCFVTFHTTYFAVRAEAVIKNIELKMVPVPRKISTSCGTAMRFCYTQLKEISVLLEQNSIQFEAIYKQSGNDYELIVKGLE